MKGLDVLATGPLATVQDLGRPGLAELGVARSGAADRGSLRLANRLVGNPEAAAAIEVTLGGLQVRALGHLLLALAGAPCPGGATNAPFYLHDGEILRLGPATSGLRTYLAVRGGIDVAPVLGSRSTDLLAGIGPPVLQDGVHLPVGSATAPGPLVDLAPVPSPPAGTVVLRVLPGPRHDWFTDDALDVLTGAGYEVHTDSNRVGMRLLGPALRRRSTQELPSEGMVTGALQVPPSGLPTLLLADHPVTGGYPVIAVVRSADLDAAAQARPGQRVRFTVG